jgi:hypothetical protein
MADRESASPQLHAHQVMHAKHDPVASVLENFLPAGNHAPEQRSWTQRRKSTLLLAAGGQDFDNAEQETLTKKQRPAVAPCAKAVPALKSCTRNSQHDWPDRPPHSQLHAGSSSREQASASGRSHSRPQFAGRALLPLQQPDRRDPTQSGLSTAEPSRQHTSAKATGSLYSWQQDKAAQAGTSVGQPSAVEATSEGLHREPGRAGSRWEAFDEDHAAPEAAFDQAKREQKHMLTGDPAAAKGSAGIWKQQQSLRNFEQQQQFTTSYD